MVRVVVAGAICELGEKDRLVYHPLVEDNFARTHVSQHVCRYFMGILKLGHEFCSSRAGESMPTRMGTKSKQCCCGKYLVKRIATDIHHAPPPPIEYENIRGAEDYSSNEPILVLSHTTLLKLEQMRRIGIAAALRDQYGHPGMDAMVSRAVLDSWGTTKRRCM